MSRMIVPSLMRFMFSKASAAPLYGENEASLTIYRRISKHDAVPSDLVRTFPNFARSCPASWTSFKRLPLAKCQYLVGFLGMGDERTNGIGLVDDLKESISSRALVEQEIDGHIDVIAMILMESCSSTFSQNSFCSSSNFSLSLMAGPLKSRALHKS